MNIKEAWEYIAHLCENDLIQNRHGRIIVNIYRCSGICSIIERMCLEEKISENVWNQMQSIIDDYQTECNLQDETFLWPLTYEGMWQRAEFCLNQAHYLETIGV